MHHYAHTDPALVIYPPHPFDTERPTLPVPASAPDPRHPRPAYLPGAVVRITYVQEYQVTDENVLLRAAVARGWQPLPASELADDDPRDLIGAVMALTEDPDVAGTRTLEFQSSAELLRPHDGYEPTGWSTAPDAARLRYDRPLRGRWNRPAAGDLTPDFAGLFTIRACPCTGDDTTCGECRWQLTPRTADLLHTALAVLADQAYDDAQHLGDHFLPDAGSATWEVFDRLPPLTWAADHRWRRRMARAFDDLADDLVRGNWPRPTCTAEEMALHLAIEDAPAHLEDLPEEDDHYALPAHGDDYSCSDLLFQDRDGAMPFPAELPDAGDPQHRADRSAGVGDLGRAAWFAPFDHRNGRDPRRGFRR